MEDRAALTTTYGRGWRARRGGSSDNVGDGLEYEDGKIRLPLLGESGVFRNPTITIDEYGRVIMAEEGVTPEILPTATVPNVESLATVESNVLAATVLNTGEDRSAIFLREEEGGEWRGPAYITGATGPQGIQGLAGEKGDAGPDGVKGDRGEKGDSGPAGPQGVTGERGAQGIQGLQGSIGPQGPQGIRGADGAQVPEGPMGAFLTPDEYGNLDENAIARIQSYGRRYFFLVNPDGDIRSNQNSPSGISGDMALHLIGYDGSSWTDYGQLTGAQGPRGNDGAQGQKGDQGIQGIQGLAGPKGEQGERGIAGDRGPAGIQGISGVEGPQGPVGETGPAGPAGPSGRLSLSYSNQLPNRSANTWYQAGANDRIVHILTNYMISTPSSNIQMRKIGTTSPTFGVKSTAIDSVNNNQAVQAIVPAGWEYRFVPGGTRTISEWFEGVYS